MDATQATTQARRGKRTGARNHAVFLAATAAILPLALAACSGSGNPPGAAASGPSQGAAGSTIPIGIPYVDLASVDKQFGLKINQGSYPDAYNALVDSLNAHGGINGRKVVPYLVAVNPTGTVAAATACTQLVEDDHVFAVLGPLSAECYLAHGIPAIQGTQPAAALPAGSAPNFELSPPPMAFDPVQLTAFAGQGLFAGKKVGLFAGGVADESELKIVQSALAADHVAVAQTAVDEAPASDQVASNQQIQLIAERFRAAGVNEVVAVGSGSASWPAGLQANQSTYNPSWVATSETDLQGYAAGDTVSPQYLQNVVAASAVPTQAAEWQDPLIQQCVSVIRKAFPSDPVESPIGQSPSATAHDTYISAENACQNLAIFAAIAKLAGPNLTVASFEAAGYRLRNQVFPGIGSAVSFGPNQPYATGSVYPVRFDATAKALVQAEQPVGGTK
jgi:hypothetical protein